MINSENFKYIQKKEIKEHYLPEIKQINAITFLVVL